MQQEEVLTSVLEEEAERVLLVALEELVPQPFGFEDQVYHFTDSTFPAGAMRHVVATVFHLFDRIGDGDRETDPTKNRELHQIIADCAHLFIDDAKALEHFVIGGQFEEAFLCQEINV